MNILNHRSIENVDLGKTHLGWIQVKYTKINRDTHLLLPSLIKLIGTVYSFGST